MRYEANERQLQNLVTVFLEENAKLNLSAFRTEKQCYVGNVLDSIAAMPLLEELGIPKSGTRFLDIGTGGGFPLLPLAMSMPESQFVGLDATQKKIDAIARIAEEVGLQNVALLCGRTEELGQVTENRELADIVTARAVAPLNTLLEYAAPFCAVDGYILAWKSMRIDTELEESLLARAELSCHLEKQYEYDLGGDWGKRQILVLKKTCATPAKYPRATGEPKKHPIV